MKLLSLAHIATQERNFLLEIRPALERLSRLSRETVHLGVLDGYEIVHVDKVESPERVGVASKTGSRAIAHHTGLGKAILAASPDGFVQEYLAYAKRQPGEGHLDDPDAMLRELHETRERGYSIDNEEDSVGVRCLGVAIRGAFDAPLFAISLTGPSPRFTLERVLKLAPEVVAIAESLSHQFGWDPNEDHAFVQSHNHHAPTGIVLPVI